MLTSIEQMSMEHTLMNKSHIALLGLSSLLTVSAAKGLSNIDLTASIETVIINAGATDTGAVTVIGAGPALNANYQLSEDLAVSLDGSIITNIDHLGDYVDGTHTEPDGIQYLISASVFPAFLEQECVKAGLTAGHYNVAAEDTAGAYKKEVNGLFVGITVATDNHSADSESGRGFTVSATVGTTLNNDLAATEKRNDHGLKPSLRRHRQS